MYTGFWWGNLNESEIVEVPCVDGSIILSWNFRNWDGAWPGFIWLRIETYVVNVLKL